jgi:hypothetical protein
MSSRSRLASRAAIAVAAIVIAGCGNRPAASGQHLAATSAARPSLATVVGGAGGASWAIAELGGSSASHDNFWELFVRPAGAARWKLDTPPGVADNGGLVAADPGGRSLVTGFRPSQGLTFSPLAVTADDGASWSPGTPVSPGLANVPDALAAGPGGRLIALSLGGRAQLGTRPGAAWRTLTSEQALAAAPAGKACGLTGLTAAAFAADGSPLLAGACSHPGIAGIFALRGGSWQPTGPALPAAQAGRSVTVLGLATAGSRTTALLVAGTGPATSILAAWSTDGGSRWSLSPQYRAAAAALSVSFGTGGSAAIVLTGDHGVALAGPGNSWRPLPALPAGTAALAVGPAGRLDALAASGRRFSDWRLGPGSTAWSQAQVIHVAIPYGSSG